MARGRREPAALGPTVLGPAALGPQLWRSAPAASELRWWSSGGGADSEAVVPEGSGGVGDEEDMVEPESLDTKLVEPGILPDLLRRL